MSNRLSKQQMAALFEVHEKTIERYIENEDFRTGTGYQKNPLNGRVTFDSDLAMEYRESAGLSGSVQTIPDNKPGTALERVEQVPWVLSMARAAAEKERDRAAETMYRAFLVPHKLFLTIKEAQSLTSWPQNALRPLSEKVHSVNCKVRKRKDPGCNCPRLIRRAKLEEL